MNKKDLLFNAPLAASLELSGSSGERIYDIPLTVRYDHRTRNTIVCNLYDTAHECAEDGIGHNPFLPDNELFHELK